MPKQTQADLFIRILIEELDAHRLVAKSDFSRNVKTHAKRFKQFCAPAPDTAMGETQPPDCLHHVHASCAVEWLTPLKTAIPSHMYGTALFANPASSMQTSDEAADPPIAGAAQ